MPFTGKNNLLWPLTSFTDTKGSKQRKCKKKVVKRCTPQGVPTKKQFYWMGRLKAIFLDGSCYAASRKCNMQ